MKNIRIIFSLFLLLISSSCSNQLIQEEEELLEKGQEIIQDEKINKYATVHEVNIITTVKNDNEVLVVYEYMRENNAFDKNYLALSFEKTKKDKYKYLRKYPVSEMQKINSYYVLWDECVFILMDPECTELDVVRSYVVEPYVEGYYKTNTISVKTIPYVFRIGRPGKSGYTQITFKDESGNQLDEFKYTYQKSIKS